MPAFARCQESQGVSWGVPDLCLMLLLPSRAHFRAPHEEHWGYSGQEPPGAPGKWSANPVIDGNGFSKSPFL